jgi:hypothetical protein
VPAASGYCTARRSFHRRVVTPSCFMTSTCLSPHSTQLPISSFMSPGLWLSFYDFDVSDKDDDDITPANSAADEVGACSVSSSYADDPNLTHFVSVADLQRTPGAIAIDFFLFCLGMPAGGTGSLLPSPSPLPPPALGRSVCPRLPR